MRFDDSAAAKSPPCCKTNPKKREKDSHQPDKRHVITAISSMTRVQKSFLTI